MAQLGEIIEAEDGSGFTVRAGTTCGRLVCEFRAPAAPKCVDAACKRQGGQTGRAGAAATAAHRSRLAASLPLAQVLWPHGGTHLEVGPCPTIEEAQMISDALAGALLCTLT